MHGGRVVLWDAEGATDALDAQDGAALDRWPRTYGDWERVQAPRAVWADDAPVDGQRAPPSGCAGRIVAADHAEGRVAALCNDGTLVVGPTAGPLRRLPTEAQGDHIATSTYLGSTPDSYS